MSDPTAADRLLRAFRVLTASALPEERFHGLYEYVVTDSREGYVDVRPADPSMGLPDLGDVRILPSAMGELVTANTGSACAIMFLDGKPTKPRCVSVEGPSDTVRAYADDMYLGASSSLGVARETDPICLGYFCVDTTTNTIYRSPPELGPLLTVYVPWQKFTSVADVYWCVATNPATPTVPPPPGTPGTAVMGIVNDGSSRVRCA
jgi:hypothetical protein